MNGDALADFVLELKMGNWPVLKILTQFETQLQALVGTLVSLPLLTSKYYGVIDQADLAGHDRKVCWEKIVRLTDPEARFVKTDIDDPLIQEAFALLPASFPSSEIIREVVWVEGVKFRGASSPRAMTAVFFCKENVVTSRELAISIVHEMAHQELFCFNLLDPLVPGGQEKHIHAPLQGVARPPMGRLHSAHALFRMITLEKIIAPELVTKHSLHLFQTIKTFADEELTDFGHRLVHEVYPEIL